MLLTVPGITNIDYGEWKDRWLWPFTARSIQLLLEECFPGARLTVKTRAMCLRLLLSCTACMGVGKVTEKELQSNDPHYQVIVTAIAEKALA